MPVLSETALTLIRRRIMRLSYLDLNCIPSTFEVLNTSILNLNCKFNKCLTKVPVLFLLSASSDLGLHCLQCLQKYPKMMN